MPREASKECIAELFAAADAIVEPMCHEPSDPKLNALAKAVIRYQRETQEIVPEVGKFYVCEWRGENKPLNRSLRVVRCTDGGWTIELLSTISWWKRHECRPLAEVTLPVAITNTWPAARASKFLRTGAVSGAGTSKPRTGLSSQCPEKVTTRPRARGSRCAN